MHDFVKSYIKHLEDTGLLIYVEHFHAKTFHNIFFSHCTARGSGYPYMYTLQLQFFPPPFPLLQHEYLDIVLNAIQ